MKIIGLIGGMSWESTITYYKEINKIAKEKLGGFHSAKCILYSIDFQEIEECMSKDNWKHATEILTDAAINLQKCGADFVVMCTNTMHKLAEDVQKSIKIPILHIAKVTAEEIIENKMKRVILLGTKYTMEQNFYKDKLKEKGISLIIPNKKEIDIINSLIFSELCHGILSIKSKKIILNIVNELKNKGAEGVILACTEIGLIVKQSDLSIPVIDTALIHAKYSILRALDEK